MGGGAGRLLEGEICPHPRNVGSVHIHIFRIGLAEFCLKRTMHPTCQLSCTSGIVLESGTEDPNLVNPR